MALHQVGRLLLLAGRDGTTMACWACLSQVVSRRFQESATISEECEINSRMKGSDKSSVKSYVKGERSGNLCCPSQISRQLERPEAFRHMLVTIPRVDTGQVDMLPAQRRDMLEQMVRNLPTRVA